MSTRKWVRGVAVTVLALAAAFAPRAEAITITWTGAVSTVWANTNNWIPKQIPGSGDDVVIDGNYVSAPTLDLTGGATNINSLSLGANFTSVLTVANGDVTTKKLIVATDVTIGTKGTLQHADNSSAETHRLFLDIGGNLTIAAGGKIDVHALGYDNGYGPPGAPNNGGGAHGGQDRSGGGATYGNYLAPTNLGSGGYDSGGSGGGAIRLTVGGVTTNNGLIRADGLAGGFRGAAGGSVFLTTGKIAGSGTITAKGGYHTGSTGYGGGGGRIAVILTTSGADFADFPTTNIIAYGGRLGTDSGGAAGTVYVQTGNQAAGEGTLIIDNGGQVSSNTRTAIPANQTWTAHSLILRGRGWLGVSSNATFDLRSSPVSDALTAGIVLGGGQFKIPSTLAVTNWTLTVNGAHSVTGNVVVGGATSGVINHWANPIGNTQVYSMDLTIDGNLTIETNGFIDVQGRGYAAGYGPGTSANGGAHGGRDQAGGGNTYGSATAPITLGSGQSEASNGGSGGGAIRLTVTGVTTNNGLIRADGTVAGLRGAAGGSVFLTTGRIAGSGTITAKGGYHTGSAGYAGGGGRVAVVITNAGAAFADFPATNIVAYGATGGGSAGTVYLQTGNQAAGAGTLIVDNNNMPAANANVVASLDDQIARTAAVGNVILRNGGRFHVGGNDRIEVSGVWTNAGTFSAAQGGVVAFTGAGEGTVYGSTTFSELVCTNAGKLLKFEAGKTFTVTNGLRFTGAAGNLLRLESTAPAAQWNLTLPAGTVQRDVSYLAVSNSNAGAGQEIVARNSDDNGGNVKWLFSNPQPITWTGGSNSVWSVGANWDLNRAPMAADPTITIGTGPNAPALDATYSYDSALIIAPSATLNLNGSSLTIGGAITNQGAIVASNTETLAAAGDVDFTGGAFTPARSTLRLAGTAAQTFRPDGKAFNILDIGTTQSVTVGGGFSAQSVTFPSSSAAVRFESAFAATNLRCIVTGGAALTFAGGAETAIGYLTLRGANGAPIVLRSTSGGSQWLLRNTGYAAVRYVDAQDSNADSGRTIVAIDSTGAAANNSNWDFGSGRLWTGTANNQFSNAANWSPAAVPGNTNHVVIDGSAATAPVVGSAVTIGGLTMANLSGSATLTVNAPFTSSGFLTVTGNVVIGTNATVAHAFNDTAESYRVDLAVGGNLTIAPGGGIDVTGLGYGGGAGPGGRVDGSGSHGGLGGRDSGYLLTYGSAVAPTNMGSGGDSSGGNGGGAIRLDVTGAAVVDGRIVADGQQGSARCGAGGSVYLTAGTLTGSGVIRANGGIHSTSPWAGGGGGRVAAILRQAGADFSGFGGTLQARGGNDEEGFGAAGTVYRQTGSQAAGTGTLTIDNAGLATAVGVFTTIPAQKWPNVEELKKAAIVVTNYGRLAVATNAEVRSLTVSASTENLNLGTNNAVLTVRELTVNGVTYTRGGLYTTNNWNGYGSAPANVTGSGAVQLKGAGGAVILLR